jgi:hypothetical protein
MVKFQLDEEDENNKLLRRTIVEDTAPEDIDEMMDVFVQFLRGVSYGDNVIRKGLENKLLEMQEEINNA